MQCRFGWFVILFLCLTFGGFSFLVFIMRFEFRGLYVCGLVFWLWWLPLGFWFFGLVAGLCFCVSGLILYRLVDVICSCGAFVLGCGWCFLVALRFGGGGFVGVWCCCQLASWSSMVPVLGSMGCGWVGFVFLVWLTCGCSPGGVGAH